MRYEEYTRQLIEDYMKHGIVDGSGFPSMELYIDQMAACLNKELSLYGDGRKTPITKSIISNYTKHKMIPGPEGKKYTKNHMIFMAIVFYLKDCFSMDEVQRLMKPVLENYESVWDEKLDIPDMYSEIIEIVKHAEVDLPAKIGAQIKDIKKLLSDKEYADDDISELVILITTLIMRSNAERFLAEKLLNEYFADGKKKKSDKSSK